MQIGPVAQREKKIIENQNGIASEELMFYLFNALPLDAIDSPNSLICIRRFIHSGGTYLIELQSYFVSKVNIWINNFGENLAECSSTKFASKVLEFFRLDWENVTRRCLSSQSMNSDSFPYLVKQHFFFQLMNAAPKLSPFFA